MGFQPTSWMVCEQLVNWSTIYRFEAGSQPAIEASDEI
jgi:hypothetical protein